MSAPSRVNPHRAGNILHRLLAAILEGVSELVADMIVRGAGYADSSGFGKSLRKT